MLQGQRIEAGEGGDPCVEIPLSILEEPGVECERCYPGPDMGQVVIHQMANVAAVCGFVKQQGVRRVLHGIILENGVAVAGVMPGASPEPLSEGWL